MYSKWVLVVVEKAHGGNRSTGLCFSNFSIRLPSGTLDPLM